LSNKKKGIGQIGFAMFSWGGERGGTARFVGGDDHGTLLEQKGGD